MTLLAIDQRSTLEDGLYTGEEICTMRGENGGVAEVSHMSFLAIDQRSNLEDGLYTGEEICTMLGENDGIGGLGHVGVEMELDPGALSTDVTIEEEEEEEDEGGQQAASPVLRSRPDYNRLAMVDRRRSAVAAATVTAAAAATYETDTLFVTKKLNSKYSADQPTTTINIGQSAATVAAVNSRSFSKRIIGGKVQILKRMLLRKATSRIKTIVVEDTSLPSLNAQKTLQNAGNKHQQSSNNSDPCDNSTCCNSSSASTIVSNYSVNDSSMAPSSITTSTCDFPSDPNLHAVFESYLMTNPWDAAKKGDFATLSYIANHDDVHIWTQKDVFGHVPLYYACVSYSQTQGHSFGKYGLESIKLLVRAWPAEIDFPKPLLELLCSRRNSIHKDVVEVLSRSRKSNTLVLPCPKEDFRIEGTKDVVPVSFLEDLGDDGYDEDY